MFPGEGAKANAIGCREISAFFITCHESSVTDNIFFLLCQKAHQLNYETAERNGILANKSQIKETL
jgi:hypothetical protein